MQKMLAAVNPTGKPSRAPHATFNLAALAGGLSVYILRGSMPTKAQAMQYVTDHHAAAVHNKPNRLCMCPQKRHGLWQHAQPVSTLSIVKQETTQTRSVSTPSQSSKSCRSLMLSGTLQFIMLLCRPALSLVCSLFLFSPSCVCVRQSLQAPSPIHSHSPASCCPCNNRSSYREAYATPLLPPKQQSPVFCL